MHGALQALNDKPRSRIKAAPLLLLGHLLHAQTHRRFAMRGAPLSHQRGRCSRTRRGARGSRPRVSGRRRCRRVTGTSHGRVLEARLHHMAERGELRSRPRGRLGRAMCGMARAARCARSRPVDTGRMPRLSADHNGSGAAHAVGGGASGGMACDARSEEHTSELQSQR